MGFFGNLNEEKYDRQYSDKDLIKRSSSYFKKYLDKFGILALTTLIVALISSAQPIIISRGIDQIATSISSGIFWLIGILIVFGVATYLLNLLNRITLYKILAGLIVNLSEDAFSSAIHHDLSFYDEIITGKIVSRITSDTREFGNLVSILADVIGQFIQVAILSVVMFQIEWRLTLLGLLVVPVTLGFASFFRRIARKVTRQGMRAMANVNSTIKETISGISVAKNFRQEISIYSEFDEANQTSYTVNIRRGLVMHLVIPILRIIGGVTTALLVYFGGLTAIQGAITIGSWYLFLTTLDRFLWPMMNISSFWTNIQNGMSAAERIYGLIDAAPSVVQTKSKPVPILRGDIKFEKVDFAYIPTEPLLDQFDLHIQPGETLAIVGHTGAGKTSIARLIERFYEFQHGRILVDDMDIRQLDLQSYRKQLGIVSQVPFLFSGTVLENIRYAKPHTKIQEILDIANKIGEGEWLDTLPNGLDTEVGERGGQLSMGQRQLISLMRVLVQKPAIFILDEATASIDPFTEWQIQQALNMIMHSTTSILIAHRLSTVQSADRIITIEKGKIIEEGNHDSLINQNGHYATLYDTYFRHQSLSYVENAKVMGRAAD